ncbi:alpha/beta hydrolase [Hydrogenophaga sp. OTU3427]|uniref:alpha/beta hydrolase n=1 Tax=Hydrogenophaga sp. OTU3427 TaxID=3043856 RepID=UPI00313A91D8
MQTYEYERRPLLITARSHSNIKETYAGRNDMVALEVHHLVPVKRPSKTVLVFMHPIGGTQYLPMISGMAKSGVHVISANSRYPRNESALIMEKVALDLGAVVAYARAKLGYENVVLAGWSGGGSLSLFYQSQAENPTITHTPAGDPVDLVGAGLKPADGIMLLAAHRSRNKTLTEWLDPSITDESRPLERDPSLNLYGVEVPEQAPFSAAFIERYRAAQIARNRRITAWAQNLLEDARRKGRNNWEHCFVVHGTMAEPAWLDATIEPSDRKPGVCFMGDPRMVNDAPAGLGRYSSLRSWLSQFSYDLSQADGVLCAARLSVPALLIENSADDGCLPHHTTMMYDALASKDKEKYVVKGANHYYFDQPELLREAMGKANEWLVRKGFLQA